MSLIEAVLFDLDGTLIDSAPVVGGILNGMRSENGQRPHGIERYRTWISLGASELVARSMVGVSGHLPSLLEEFRRRYRECPTPEDALFSGAAWVLGVLRSHGVKLGICSNKPESLCKKVLAETRVVDFFDIVVGGDTIAHSKPSPEPLKFASRELDVSVEAAVLVGDSTIDQKASDAAGMPFIFFSGGYDDGVDTSLARMVISDLKQIVEVIPNRNESLGGRSATLRSSPVHARSRQTGAPSDTRRGADH